MGRAVAAGAPADDVAATDADDVPGPQADSGSPVTRPGAKTPPILVVRVKCRKSAVIPNIVLMDKASP